MQIVERERDNWEECQLTLACVYWQMIILYDWSKEIFEELSHKIGQGKQKNERLQGTNWQTMLLGERKKKILK